MVIDRLENSHLYCNLPQLKAAFSLLQQPTTLALPEGRIELDGERIVAMPQSYQTRLHDAGRWEAHRRYIDIQYIVAGVELMGWAPVDSLRPVTDFDPVKDVGFYQGMGDLVRVEAGMFTLFFPQDAHMPCLAINNQPQTVRKIVMKVAV